MSKILIDEATLKLALEAAYLAGFNDSGEGYNGEYPFRDHNSHPEQDACWLDERAACIGRVLAALPAQYSDIVSDGGMDPRNKFDVPAQQCKWPTCQGDEFQQALAEQIKRELVGEQPAQPVALVIDGVLVKSELPEKYTGHLYTSPPAQQEPVAWREFDGEHGYFYRDYYMNEQYAQEWDQRNPNHKGWVEPLYTSPPAQRKPLTDEEIENIWRRVDASDFVDCVQPFVRAIEAAHGIKENK